MYQEKKKSAERISLPSQASLWSELPSPNSLVVLEAAQPAFLLQLVYLQHVSWSERVKNMSDHVTTLFKITMPTHLKGQSPSNVLHQLSPAPLHFLFLVQFKSFSFLSSIFYYLFSACSEELKISPTRKNSPAGWTFQVLIWVV